MDKQRNRYQLKGFTIAELLVVLILTSVSITLSYSTLSFVQKLFSEYKKSNKFLNEFTDFKKRMDFESLKAEQIAEESENSISIKRDSVKANLEFKEHVILLKRNQHCDTFHFEAKKITKKYELIQNPLFSNKLIRELRFETEYGKQKFVFCFTKEHSASLKLKLEQL